MHVKRITSTGLKGWKLRTDLTPLTFITGANDSGKTTHFAAIQLALCGYIPGKKPARTGAAIMEYSSGPEISVAALLSEGTTVARSWVRSGSSVKASKDQPDPLDLPLMDASAFFAMGPTERLAYTFERVVLPQEFTPEGIVAACLNVSLEENTEATELAKGEIAQLVRKTLAGTPKINDGIALLTKTGGVIRETISYQKRRANETIGAVRVNLELRSREGSCSAEALTSLKAEVDRLNGLKQAVRGKVATLDERAKSAGAIQAQRTALEGRLAAPLHDFDTDIATMRVELTTEERREAPAAPTGDFNQLQANVTTAAEKVARVSTASRSADVRSKELQAELDDLEKAPCCPHCKSTGDQWKANLRQTTTAKLQSAKEALAAAEKDYRPAKTAYDQANAALVAFNAHREFQQGHERRLQLIHQKIATLEHEKATAIRARERDQETLAGLVTIAPPEEAEYEAIEREDIDISEKLEAATTEHDTALALAQDLRRAAQAQKDHEEAKAKLAVAEAILDLLLAKQEEMIAAAMEKTLVAANDIVGPALASPIAFHEGDLGRWNGSGFIHMVSFGQSEEALAYVGVAAALSSTAALKVVMLDEFDRMDDARQANAIACLEDAVTSGKLDQVIIAAPRIPAAALMKNWSIIRR